MEREMKGKEGGKVEKIDCVHALKNCAPCSHVCAPM